MKNLQFLFDEQEAIAADRKIATIASDKIRLRDYQRASVDAIFGKWRLNQSTLLVLPTGTGKSVCFSAVMDRWQQEQTGKIMLMAHRKELIYQAVGHARRAGLVAMMEMGNHRASKNVDVVVSTVQTLMAKTQCVSCFGEGCDDCQGTGKVRRLTRFNPHDFGLLTIDEGHHAMADSYRAVIKWFARNQESRLLLVTATPKRSDKKGLANICQSVAYQMQLKEAIDNGWLVPIRQRFVTVSGLDLSQVKTRSGDLAAGEIEQAFLGTDEDEERLLHEIAKPTLDEAKGQQVIVFSSGKEHAEKLTAAFNSYDGVEARFVTESTPVMERDRIVSDYKSGRFQVLINCMVFTEGFDCPATAVVANCRPTKSESLYLQIIGRGTRPLPGVVDGLESPDERRTAIAESGKPFAIVLDFVGNSGQHKLVSVVDVLAGDTVDQIDLQEALRVAREADAAVDVEEIAEKIRAARQEQEERENEQKAKRLLTNTYASSADYSAIDVDLFAGARFDAANEPTAATKAQCYILKEYCGMKWRQAAKLTSAEANARIIAAKANARKAVVQGLRSAGSVQELVTMGANLAQRLSKDRLIDSTSARVEFREAYRQRMGELIDGQ